MTLDSRTPLSRQDSVTVVVVAVAFIGLLPPAFLADTYSSLEMSLAVLALAATASIGHRMVTWSRLALPVPLLVLLAVMSASVLWSSATLNTLRDVAGFLCLGAAAWLLVQRSRPVALVGGIVVAGGLIVAVSIIAFLVDPVAATQQSSGALEGVYANRNQFGFVMLQCFTAALVLDARSRGWLIAKLCTSGLFFTMVIASFSKTSLIAAIVVAGVWLLITALRRSLRYLWVGAAVFGAAIIATFLNSATILDFLGKDETLNGRAEIWTALVAEMGASPVLGFGFLREWPGWSTQSLAVAAEMDGLQVVHAHNELLSWWSGTGILGVLAIVSLYAFVYTAGWRMFRSPRIDYATWPLLTMIMLNVHGITSTSETKPQGWFIFMLIVFVCVEWWRADTAMPRSLVLNLRVGRDSIAEPERSIE